MVLLDLIMGVVSLSLMLLVALHASAVMGGLAGDIVGVNTGERFASIRTEGSRWKWI